jgi:hypothetical protein
MIKHTILIVLFYSSLYAEVLTDSDLDGVVDSMDLCPNTSFLDEVDKNGCTINRLITLQDTNPGKLDIAIGYGFSHNEDLLERDMQHHTHMQVSYYIDNWNYTLRTGYFTSDRGNGAQDTTLKMKYKYKPFTSLKVSLGMGIKLPTYEFVGNKTDYTLYSALTYYFKSPVSLFTGMSYTFVNDEDFITAKGEIVPLHNTKVFYVGSSYSITEDIYANLSYSYAENKFTLNHNEQNVIATLFYKIDKRWFTTLSYSHQIEDDDLHNALHMKIGYILW